MTKYYLYDEVFFIPMKQETKIIEVMPKGEAGLKQDYYIVECKPDKAFTAMALKPIVKVLKQKEKINKCIGCRFLVDIPRKEAYCFVSNQLVRNSITMDLRPNKCIKGTPKELELNKGVKNMSKKISKSLTLKESFINEQIFESIENTPGFNVNLISNGSYTFYDVEAFLKSKDMLDIFGGFLKDRIIVPFADRSYVKDDKSE